MKVYNESDFAGAQPQSQSATETTGRKFRPSIEAETGITLIQTRRPARIEDGRLIGSEIVAVAPGFKVWTARVRLAREIGRRHALRLRLLDREAELMVPADLADAILPRFGARVRRTLTDQEREARIARLKGRPNGPNFAPGAQKNEVPDA